MANRVFVSGALQRGDEGVVQLATTSRGVPAGATRPHQVSIEKPFSVPATVGTSGSALLRSRAWSRRSP